MESWTSRVSPSRVKHAVRSKGYRERTSIRLLELSWAWAAKFFFFFFFFFLKFIFFLNIRGCHDVYLKDLFLFDFNQFIFINFLFF